MHGRAQWFPRCDCKRLPADYSSALYRNQIRNSIKYVASQNQKEFMLDLKLVYQAVNKDVAEKALDDLEVKWVRTIRLSSRVGVTIRTV